MSSPAPAFADEIDDAITLKSPAPSKLEDVVHYGSGIPPLLGLDRNQLGDGHATPRDDDALPLLHPIQELGQVGLRLIGPDRGHE